MKHVLIVDEDNFKKLDSLAMAENLTVAALANRLLANAIAAQKERPTATWPPKTEQRSK